MVKKVTVDSALDAIKLKQEPETEKKVEVETQSVKYESPKVNLAHVKYAYSLIENDGKYHVISVEYDPHLLVAGKVKKIESNTEKFLMQERLQVLLMGDDLI
jgi:copper chaperone CopZ